MHLLANGTVIETEITFSLRPIQKEVKKSFSSVFPDLTYPYPFSTSVAYDVCCKSTCAYCRRRLIQEDSPRELRKMRQNQEVKALYL